MDRSEDQSFALSKKSDQHAALGPLLADANHAVGNLVHRLYYLAELLEQDLPADASSETIAQVKQSIASVHQLVSRTFALVRPVQARCTLVPAADLMNSIAVRFDCTPAMAPDVIADLRELDVEVDPSHLDRALALIVESLGCLPDGRRSASLCFVPVQSQCGRDASRLLRFDVVRFGTRDSDLHDTVQVDLGMALAARLLSVCGLSVMIDEQPSQTLVRISVPAISKRDAAMKAANFSTFIEPQA